MHAAGARRSKMRIIQSAGTVPSARLSVANAYSPGTAVPKAAMVRRPLSTTPAAVTNNRTVMKTTKTLMDKMTVIQIEILMLMLMLMTTTMTTMMTMIAMMNRMIETLNIIDWPLAASLLYYGICCPGPGPRL